MNIPSRVQNAPIYIIFAEVVEICQRHKKTALIVFVVELWIHSLMFSHLAELKSLWQLLPFFN
jgi:hypothetical protein